MPTLKLRRWGGEPGIFFFYVSSIKGGKRVERSNLWMGISEDSKQQNEQKVKGHSLHISS